jgi:hypothetical protein
MQKNAGHDDEKLRCPCRRSSSILHAQ